MDLVSRLLPAFNTGSGIPYSLINLQSCVRSVHSPSLNIFSTHRKAVKNYVWASGGSSILAEAGTLHMEMMYLSEVTGNAEYANKVCLHVLLETAL